MGESYRPEPKEENPNEWRRGSTFMTPSRESGRDLEEYEKDFGFDRRELAGLTVLDLGSGATEKFSRELKQSRIEANVISLNPDYSHEPGRSAIIEKKDWQRKSVAAIGQELPFADETFDRIYGHSSVTFYSGPGSHPEAAKKWLSEVIRVLKPNGEAFLGPVSGVMEPYHGERILKVPPDYVQLVETVKEMGVEIEFRPFGENYDHTHYDAQIVIKKLGTTVEE